MASGLWLLAAGPAVALAAWLVDRRRRAYTDLATTPAAAVFVGRNEIEGRAWTASPLVSHRSQTPSIWWSYKLEEERRHTRSTQNGTRTYTQWHEIDRRDSQLPWFEVVDETGSVLVGLAHARVEGRPVFEDTFRDDESRGLLDSLFANRTGRYRESEDAVAVGDQLFVAGEAELDEQAFIPLLRRDVLVSTRSEESRTFWLGVGVVVLVLLALGGVVVGSAQVLAPEQPERPTAWLPGVAASVVLLTIAWSVTLYNRLRLLAESTERAWTLVDIQLQRRHDLIPALAKIVAAHAAHEATVLAQVAGARADGGGDGGGDGEAQHAAELTGEAAEQTTRLRQILGVAEAHPELTADAAFLELQRTLADTESRIAGSRTFYNDTLLLLRNQMTRFPGVLVASRLRLAHREPIGAEGFERTVPEVERSFA